MKRSTFNDARRQTTSTSAREMLRRHDSDEHDGLKENQQRVPISMLLIIGALMGASD